MQVLVNEFHGNNNDEHNEREDRNERLSKDRNEIRKTVILTAVFDTLDSKPVLKTFRIRQTISDREVHTEKQAESRSIGTEIQNEEQTVEMLHATSLHTKLKEKPVRDSGVWWIAGGAAVVLLLLCRGVAKKYGKHKNASTT